MHMQVRMHIVTCEYAYTRTCTHARARTHTLLNARIHQPKAHPFAHLPHMYAHIHACIYACAPACTPGVVHSMRTQAPSSNGSEFVSPLSRPMNSALLPSRRSDNAGSGTARRAGGGGSGGSGGGEGGGAGIIQTGGNGLEAIAAAIASRPADTESGGGGDGQGLAERQQESGLTREQVQHVGTTFEYTSKKKRLGAAASAAERGGSDSRAGTGTVVPVQ